MWIYLARGDTKRQLQWTLFHTPLVIIAVAAGTRWGPLGVAIAFTVSNWLLLYPGLVFCFAGSPLTAPRYLAIVARPLVAATVGYAVLAVGYDRLEIVHSLLPRLGLALVVYLAAYLISWLSLPGGRRAIADLHGLTKLLRVERAPQSAV
jgi:PST family polysaccharide transporter